MAWPLLNHSASCHSKWSRSTPSGVSSQLKYVLVLRSRQDLLYWYQLVILTLLKMVSCSIYHVQVFVVFQIWNKQLQFSWTILKVLQNLHTSSWKAFCRKKMITSPQSSNLPDQDNNNNNNNNKNKNNNLVIIDRIKSVSLKVIAIS